MGLTITCSVISDGNCDCRVRTRDVCVCVGVFSGGRVGVEIALSGGAKELFPPHV